MKKSVVVTLVLLIVFSFTGAAFADVSPFADVPAGDWAYGAVKQLSAAGIVEGYEDGTFRGQNTITRYEMAIITANAMTKLSNATDDQKALVAQLAVEFAPELKALHIQMTPPANNDVKVSGEVRERYEWTNGPGNQLYTRFRVNFFAPLTDSLIFKGRIESENTFGTGPADNGPYGANGTQQVNVNQAFIAGKALGFDTFVLGRIPLYLGQGLLTDSETNATTSGGADGIVLGGGGNELKYIVAAGKVGLSDDVYEGNPLTINMTAANLAYNAAPDFTLTVAGQEDKHDTLYKSSAIGFNYKGISDINMMFEYGINGASAAKAANDNNDAKAWITKVKYLGADPATENSCGFWVAYRMADPFFDPWGLGGFDAPHFFKTPTGVSGVYAMSNVKGFEYGFEQTLFKNAILSLQFDPLKSEVGNVDAKFFMASLNYSF